ncbi:MAG: VOC family protein [Rhodospirillaceae bacterium]|mgnify:FL=1|jgi:catechol 2,3-dioxygenase-like lactoylglutathione lyase family enzyme|nr:VOC family protein [Rhodospirillaceae bacterium]MBT4491275.1 VOC family protein [Rhodospirillaceae bacterium]MBT5194301.1 VOC family protein [Rhodospirillaceae bacterium]MBT5899215.1 VOC family protein [Rhodospirillaceae bacterium]MBT6428640.1 VOC family protein [Rhodospirillaceae bacterium]
MDQANPYEAKRRTLQEKYMASDAPPNTPLGTDGVHHLVLISSDLDATVAFYTSVLGMRLTKVVVNRDDPSSTHIFLDMGGGNLMAFFDFPQHGDAPAVRGIGAMHHVALKAEPTQYKALFGRLREQDIDFSLEGTEESGSVYMRDPDNALIEVTCR